MQYNGLHAFPFPVYYAYFLREQYRFFFHPGLAETFLRGIFFFAVARRVFVT